MFLILFHNFIFFCDVKFKDTFFVPSIKNLQMGFLAVIILSLFLYLISKVYSSNFKSLNSSLEAYECGFAPFDDATRQPFDIHYYIVGLLFLIFDVEITLIVPWVIDITGLNSWGSFCGVFLFLFIITAGFFYEWYIGALKWPRFSLKISSPKLKYSEKVYNLTNKFSLWKIASSFFEFGFLLLHRCFIWCKVSIKKSICYLQNKYFKQQMSPFLFVFILSNDFSDNLIPFVTHCHTEIILIFCIFCSIFQLIYLRVKRYNKVNQTLYLLSGNEKNKFFNSVNLWEQNFYAQEVILSRHLHLFFFGFMIVFNTIFFLFFLFKYLIVNPKAYFLFSNFFAQNSNYLQIDSLSIQFIVIIILILVFILVDLNVNFFFFDKKNFVGEYYFYLLSATFFLTVLIKAVHFLPVFLAFVGFGITSYLILSLVALTTPTDELMLKYFTISVCISMFMGLGMFLMTLAFGNSDITFAEMGEIFRIFQSNLQIYQKHLTFVPLYLTWIALSYLAKSNIAPFHWWVSDIYKKLDYGTLFFFAIISKIAILISFFKIYFYIFQYSGSNFQVLLFNCFLCCLFFGSVLSMFEKNLKKFIGFSSVNQLGFIFVFGVTSKIDSFYAILIYLLVYFITSFLLFVLLLTTVVIKNPLSNIQNVDRFFFSLLNRTVPFNNSFTIESRHTWFKKSVKVITSAEPKINHDELFNLLLKSKFIREIEYISDLKLSSSINKEYGYFMQTLFLFMTGLPPFFSFLPKLWVLLIQQSENNFDFVIYIFFFSIISIFYYIWITLYIITNDYTILLTKITKSWFYYQKSGHVFKEKLSNFLPITYRNFLYIYLIFFIGWTVWGFSSQMWYLYTIFILNSEFFYEGKEVINCFINFHFYNFFVTII